MARVSLKAAFRERLAAWAGVRSEHISLYGFGR